MDIGILCSYTENMYGLQLAVPVNISETLYGIQLSGIANVVKKKGYCLQISLTNWLKSGFGVQFGGLNVAKQGVGLQVGCISVADKCYGMQYSIFNLYDETLTCNGIQIGLFNGNSIFAGVLYSVFLTTIILLNSPPGDIGSPVIVKEGVMNGIQAGGFNIISTMNGIQAGAINSTDWMYGIQLSYWNIVTDRGNGLQVAGINSGAPGMDRAWTQSYAGIQLAAVGNFVINCSGIQVGFLNDTSYMKGIQIGVINYTRELTGIQLGLLNIVRESKLPVMIGINMALF